MRYRDFLTAMYGIVVTMAMAATVRADDTPLPDARPVPAMQVLPMPYDQASFEHFGRELTRYHFGANLRRPFWYPIIGQDNCSLTRMGHPHDPVGHSHHNSVWISHMNVSGVDFWVDHGPNAGQIVHQRVLQYDDSPTAATMLSLNAWNDPQGKTLMFERRRATVTPNDGGSWRLTIDLQFEAPSSGQVTLGQTPFGPIGVRMAKTIGVNDGGGRILNSAGQRNEPDVFRKPARWVDYSGPIAAEQTAGIMLMDHPKNPGHPTPFHVRNDGWMGVCLTLNDPITITPDKPLRLRYGLWIHPNVPETAKLDQQWQAFAREELATMKGPREK